VQDGTEENQALYAYTTEKGNSATTLTQSYQEDDADASQKCNPEKACSSQDQENTGHSHQERDRG
jgi:hypothetical protein